MEGYVLILFESRVMTVWYRARFLFCSFGPLYLLLCIGFAVQHHWAQSGFWHADTIAMTVSAAALVLSLVTFLQLRAKFEVGSPSRFAVEPIESLDDAVLSYMLSYLPPLLIDDLASAAKVVPAVVFYLVLGFILLRTDTMYVNPYFLLLGYRIFRVTLPSKRTVIVISKSTEIVPGETLTLHEIQPSRLFFAS